MGYRDRPKIPLSKHDPNYDLVATCEAFVPDKWDVKSGSMGAYCLHRHKFTFDELVKACGGQTNISLSLIEMRLRCSACGQKGFATFQGSAKNPLKAQ